MDEKAQKSKKIWEQACSCEPPIGQDLQKAMELYEQALETDSRNVLACHDLARLYATKLDDLEQAETYCREGLAIADIPPEIKTASPGGDVVEEAADDFNNLMMLIRLKQGRKEDAREYLDKMKTFFDKYSQGSYYTAFQTFEEAQQPSLTGVNSGQKKGRLFVIAAFLLIFIIGVVFLIS